MQILINLAKHNFLTRISHILLITSAILFSGCAQVALLSGGPRDLNPPKLLESVPQNASVNFNGKSIELKFDEFVNVRDIANQLVVTPQTREMPLVEARGKKVIIKFNENLIANATYRLFFGNSISDMHEGNVVSNFEFVFSTGSFIDSLKLNGNVKSAFSLNPEKDIMVALYEAGETDSVIYKKKPLYFTKTDMGGTFNLSYLPKSAFKAFAFSDKNKNLLFDGGEEVGDFMDTLVLIPDDSSINFKVFKEEANKLFIKRSYSPYYGLANIIYNKPVYNVPAAIITAQTEFITSSLGISDTCKVYYHNIYDSLDITVKHPNNEITDTVRINVSSKEQFEKQKKEKRLSLNVTIGPLIAEKLMFNKRPFFKFNRWIDSTKTDLSRINIISKSDTLISKTPVLIYFAADNISINNAFKPNNDYQITLNDSAFTDESGIKSDSIKFSFKTTAKDDYAKLNLKLLFPKKESYIVQLLNGQNALIAEQYVELSITSSTEQVLRFNFLLPGNYFVKVIEDINHNKKWDTGNVIRHKHAENIYFNAQAIKLMADWDVEIEWKISN